MKKASLISLALFAFVSFFCLKIMVQQTKVQAAQDYTAIYEKNAVETVNKISSELAEKHWENIESFRGVPNSDWNLKGLYASEEVKKISGKNFYAYTVFGTIDGKLGDGLTAVVTVLFSPENPKGEIFEVCYVPIGGINYFPDKEILDAFTVDFWRYIN